MSPALPGLTFAYATTSTCTLSGTVSASVVSPTATYTFSVTAGSVTTSTTATFGVSGESYVCVLRVRVSSLVAMRVVRVIVLDAPTPLSHPTALGLTWGSGGPPMTIPTTGYGSLLKSFYLTGSAAPSSCTSSGLPTGLTWVLGTLYGQTSACVLTGSATLTAAARATYTLNALTTSPSATTSTVLVTSAVGGEYCYVHCFDRVS